jgi:hypothetical protein
MGRSKITGPNAGGPRPLHLRMPWAARVGRFWRSREGSHDYA